MSESEGKPPKYSENSFWDKVKKYAKVIGRPVLEKALQLYYAARAPETPTWAKTTIYSALAYFIWPLDAIPDAIPVVGYSDDLGVLAAALITVTTYVTPEIKEMASDKLKGWFGDETA